MKRVILAVSLALMTSACASTGTTGTPKVVAEASKYQGLHELKHTKKIKAVIGVNPARTPWCGYFAAAMVKKAGKTPPKNYPKARSWLKYGKAVKKSEIRAGDIVVVRNHVAIVTKVVGNRVHVISGNYSNKIEKGSYSKGQIAAARRG